MPFFLFFTSIFSDISTVMTPPVQPAAVVEVYFIPHQDDEMFMAGSIKRALDQKKDVYIVLMTDGSHSSSRSTLNGRTASGKQMHDPLLNVYHNPTKEGYAYITESKFSELRRQEFVRSLTTLGVSYDHIFSAQYGSVNEFMNKSYRDGKLSEAQASQVIARFHKQFGDAALYNAVASSKKKSQHNDHRAITLALLHDATIARKRFFSEDVKFGTPVKLSKEELVAKQNALAVYYEWNPKQEHFAIGAHSVIELLDFWKNSKYEYIVSDHTLLE